jgi:gluconate 2-dehydrogenase gamma chain
MKRREFLNIPAAALGGTLLYTLAREPLRLQSQNGNVRVPLRFFSAEEARVITSACECIFPSDANGPGATEAGVVIYIDRQLAGPYGKDKYRYSKGPWAESMPEHGYQKRESPRDVYRQGIRELGNFADLPFAEQTRRLEAIQSSVFFQLLKTHTIEGMFCDPMHGGNAGLIGWQLIGFPGPQMSYREEIDKHFGQPWRPNSKSLQQVAGRAGQPWEDEKL